jgi:UDP-glucose 4-epimerase
MSSGRTVLVTGASGFIGRHVCSRLLRARGAIVCVDHRSIPGDAAGFVACDIADPQQFEEVVRANQVEIIVHLAAVLPSASQQDPAGATRVNIGGSLNVLEAARRSAVRRVVYASSISVYGSDHGSRAVSENDPAAPNDLYGAAKRYSEVLGETYHRIFGFEFVALRVATVVGLGVKSTSSPWRTDIFEALGTKDGRLIQVPYGAEEAIPLVHVEDVAEMVALLVERPMLKWSLYNAACETCTINQLQREIEGLNNHVRIEAGEKQSQIPQRIDSRRFSEEFAYSLRPLKDHLRQALRSPHKDAET